METPPTSLESAEGGCDCLIWDTHHPGKLLPEKQVVGFTTQFFNLGPSSLHGCRSCLLGSTASLNRLHSLCQVFELEISLISVALSQEEATAAVARKAEEEQEVVDHMKAPLHASAISELLICL